MKLGRETRRSKQRRQAAANQSAIVRPASAAAALHRPASSSSSIRSSRRSAYASGSATTAERGAWRQGRRQRPRTAAALPAPRSGDSSGNNVGNNAGKQLRPMSAMPSFTISSRNEDRSALLGPDGLRLPPVGGLQPGWRSMRSGSKGGAIYWVGPRGETQWSCPLKPEAEASISNPFPSL